MNRRLIKNSLISALSSSWISAIATKFVGGGIPIFMMHQIYPDNTPGDKITPSYLRKCLSYLKEHNYNFVSIADILLYLKNNRPLPPKPVAFTIDDGFVEQATLAAPIFIEFKCPVTIFLITGFLDGQLWPWFSKVKYLLQSTTIRSFDFPSNNSKISYSLTNDNDRHAATQNIREYLKRLSGDSIDQAINKLAEITQTSLPIEPPDGFKPMTWPQARQLEETGIVSFGPHTLSHPILSRVSDEQSFTEINLSWQRLKSELKNPCPLFCYPNGLATDFGKREIEIIKKTDMKAALSTIPAHLQLNAITNSPDKLFSLPRYNLPTDIYDFIMYSSWIELLKEKLYSRKN